MNKFIVSPSPHAYTGQSVPKLMYGVIISLLPVLGVSVFYFGIGMIIVVPDDRLDEVLKDAGVRSAEGFACGEIQVGDGSVRLSRA